MVDDDSDERASPVTFVMAILSYVLFDGLYFTKARSSFCRDTAVNCATTIERKPDAFAPSACIPFIPHTERRDTLNTYGEAPETVSVSIMTAAVGPGANPAAGPAGKFALTFAIE